MKKNIIVLFLCTITALSCAAMNQPKRPETPLPACSNNECKCNPCNCQPCLCTLKIKEDAITNLHKKPSMPATVKALLAAQEIAKKCHLHSASGECCACGAGGAPEERETEDLVSKKSK